MAPVEKRLTMSAAGSTSSSGTGVRPSSSARLEAEQRADGEVPVLGLVHQPRELAVLVLRIAAGGVLEAATVSERQTWASPRKRKA